VFAIPILLDCDRRAVRKTNTAVKTGQMPDVTQLAAVIRPVFVRMEQDETGRREQKNHWNDQEGCRSERAVLRHIH
jgi:hypothetical protein